MVVLWVTALFTFNFFASGMCHASWHAMSDIKHFHTHGHRDPDSGASHPVVSIEKRSTGEHHQHPCPFFDACVKAPGQQDVRKEEVRPAPSGPDLSCPRCQARVSTDFHAPLLYRGPPVELGIAGVTPAGRNPARTKTT